VNIVEVLENQKFDFIKMDIEGAESVVLPACKNYLSDVTYLFVEYHSVINQKQSLSMILNIMSEAGFRVHVHSVMYSNSPFVRRKENSGFDLQLNIFGWKE